MHPNHSVREHQEAHAKEHVRKAGYARGGHVKHPDEKEDRALVDRMVKKDALTGKKSGGHVKGAAGKPRADRRARGGRSIKRDDGGNVPSDQMLNQAQQGDYQNYLNDMLNQSSGESNQQQQPKAPDMGDKRGGPVKHARGGRTKGKAASVNIVIATGGGEPERQMAQRQGMQIGAAMGKAAAAQPMPKPAMPPPGAGAPPPGGVPPSGAPPMPPGGMPPGGAMRPPMKRGGRAMPKMHDEWVEKHGGGEESSKDWREVQKQSATTHNFARGGSLYPLKDAGGGGAEGRAQKANAMPDSHGKIKVRAHERRRRGGACE